jgi:hypothetical protein
MRSSFIMLYKRTRAIEFKPSRQAAVRERNDVRNSGPDIALSPEIFSSTVFHSRFESCDQISKSIHSMSTL